MPGDERGSEGGGGAPSLDPRSWVAPRRDPLPPPPTEEVSLDPSTWFRPGKAPSEGAAIERGRRLPVSRRWLIGGAAAVTAGGAGLWLTLGRDRQRPPSGAAPSPAPAKAAGTLERRKLALAASDDAAAVLLRLGAPPAEAEEAARLIRASLREDAAVELVLQRSAGGALIQSLTATGPNGAGVALRRVGDRLMASPLRALTSARPVVVHGEMGDAGFYTAAVSAGMNDSLVPDFTRALAFDFDFAREVGPGDLFEAVYQEQVDAGGQVVGPRQLLFVGLRHRPSGERLAAESGDIHDKAKAAELYRFTPAGGEAGWFDAAGRGVRRSLMRTPVEGARITSVFGYRVHPVLGFTRLHEGVDFGTPVGTPVYASGDGVVERAGPASGYGNYLVIRHSPRLQTAYGHLSAFGEGIVKGAPVSQGQVVALSGNTGTSSGPHLHYEIIVDGVHIDPLTYVGTDSDMSAQSLKGAELQAFLAATKRIDVLRTGAL